MKIQIGKRIAGHEFNRRICVRETINAYLGFDAGGTVPSPYTTMREGIWEPMWTILVDGVWLSLLGRLRELRR